MAQDYKTKIQKVTNAWALYWSPLANLTQWEIRRLIQSQRTGNDIRMQIAFYDMERQAPLFGICIDKRQAGVLNRKWDILPLDNTDEARAQAEAVKTEFLKSDTRNTDGLTSALQSLVLGAFRGRACVKPFIKDGSLSFVEVPTWNTLCWNKKLYWNPTASEQFTFAEGNPVGLDQLDEDEVCYVLYDRPIDLVGIDVYLKLLIGETQWARVVEKEGVPQVVLTAPDGTPDTELDTWTSRAIALFEGGSGVLPSGAKIDQLTAARGQDPFTAYIQHQMEMVVLLALGQKMTSLGQAAGLGSNLADIQSDEFNNLVTRDCKMIQNTLTRCAVKKVVKNILKQKEVKCRFSFVEDEPTTPSEYIEMAQKLAALGATVDLQELKKLTNLTFIKDDSGDLWTPKTEEKAD